MHPLLFKVLVLTNLPLTNLNGLVTLFFAPTNANRLVGSGILTHSKYNNHNLYVK